jgi:hypothetical protein
MRMWKVLCGAAIMAVSLIPAAHADEFTKLTYFTFSAPVDMPGMMLPAGTYRFELADPESGRRVIRVSDKDGTKVHGTFLSISNQKMDAADEPLVMFKEAAAGSPQPIKAWWYPGESAGYEFVYPKDQALKIAKANHTSVLSTDGLAKADTASSDIARVSDDENLKDSTRAAATTTAAETTTAAATTTAPAATTPASTATTTAAATTTAEPVQPAPVTAEPGTPAPVTAAPEPVGTSGETTSAPRAVGTSGSLPRTASPLPLIGLFSLLSLAGGFALRVRRT